CAKMAYPWIQLKYGLDSW
nr:immunoglobulin heavy chain junction region [Macaca mulatta]